VVLENIAFDSAGGNGQNMKVEPFSAWFFAFLVNRYAHMAAPFLNPQVPL